MKIVHISDLHFGVHDKALAANLLTQVATFQPDLILCTGDVADNTKPDLFEEASSYCTKLSNHCAKTQKGGPPMIVIPGNHDFRGGGWRLKDKKQLFGTWFGDELTDWYYEDLGVWVFCFDSASEGMTGGGGVILEKDLIRFHQRYEQYAKKPGFDRAFKIVAVHHHPLPVTWGTDWKQPFLTMTNAGAFLSAVLIRRVDLVLHGHEHRQCRSHFRSTLGKEGAEVTVLSLGATLREEPDLRNWFSCIYVNPESVTADFYGSKGAVFEKEETFVISSPQQRAASAYGAAMAAKQYGIERAVSYTVITPDGDARRMVEYQKIRPAAGRNPFKDGVPISLPFTSGYVDKLRHSATAGLSLTELDEDVKEASFTATLSGYAAPGGSDLEYRWWAVSGLAMDTREFGHQYGNDADLKGNENLEFTYFPITSPIEELTIVAQFPPEYLEKIQPKPWVRRAATGSPRQWDVASQMEAALSAEGAIRIYKAMNVVSMRIPNPVDGVAYGIQWHVPEAPKRSSNLTQSERDIKEMLKQWMISGCAERVQPTMELLARCVNFAREKLMGGLAWTDPLEASIFFFDAKKRVLPVLAAALCSEDELKQVDYDQVALPYGRGIAGRAFKTNRIRAYEEIESDEPDYYYPLSDHPRFPVLACIPIQNPQAPEQGAYAVLGLGSQQSNCPLAALGKPPLTDRELAEILKQLNLLLFQELSRIYLAPKGAQSKTGAASGKTQGLDPASPGS